MRTILSLALLLAPAVALADEPAPTSGVTTRGDDDCARARKMGRTCVLSIEGEEIPGQIVKNDGDGVTALIWTKLTSLIEIRRDFIAEIVKSAEDID